MNRFWCVILMWVCLTSCSRTIDIQVVRYPWAEFEANLGECQARVYFSDEPMPRGCRDVGDVFVGDDGYSNDCDMKRMLGEVRTQACMFGADAARVIHVQHPGTAGSTCYQVRAALMKCPSAQSEGVP